MAPQTLVAIMPVYNQVKEIPKEVIIGIRAVLKTDYNMVRKGEAEHRFAIHWETLSLHYIIKSVLPSMRTTI